METKQYPDYFEVINGPEDGVEFLVVRAPVFIGSAPECAINLRLDSDVDSKHAKVTVVSGGYRIRSLSSKPLYVDGKRAGKLKSRIVKSGQNVLVGNTKLCLSCAHDGLASRSRGIVTESDFAWALRSLLAFPIKPTRYALRFLRGVLRFALKHWFISAIIATVIAFNFSPVFGRFVRGLWSNMISKIPLPF